MAIVSRNAGRGAALANAVNRAKTAAVVSKIATAVAQQAVANKYVPPKQVASTAYTPPKQAYVPAPTGQRVAAPAGSSRPAVTRAVAPAPPPNIIAQNLRQRVQTPAPVAAAMKFIEQNGVTGYSNIENARAATRYTRSVPLQVSPPATSRESLYYNNIPLTSQQQMADYDLMRMQAGMPPTQMGGYGDQYTIPPGTRVVSAPKMPPSQERVPAASKFIPENGVQGYENIENSRANALPRMSSLTPIQQQQQRQAEQNQQRLNRITAGFEQDAKRNAKTDTENEVARLNEERDFNRLMAIQQEIRSIEGQLDSSNPYLAQLPVDQLVDMEARLQTLRNIEQGIYTDNSSGNTLWENISHIDLRDIINTGSNITKVPVIGPIAEGIADTIAELSETTIAEWAGEQGSRFLRWWDGSVVGAVREDLGTLLYQYASNDPNAATWDWKEGIALAPLSFAAAVPFMIAMEVDDVAGDGSFRQDIVDAYENGYGGRPGDPAYSGDQAVWEFMVGQADDLPWPVRFGLLAIMETLVDPSTPAGAYGRGGSAIGRLGAAIAAIPDATRTERVISAGLRAGGFGIQHAGSFVDTLGIEHGIGLVKRGARHVPGFGLTNESIATRQSENMRTLQQSEAEGEAGTAASRADARGQGVTPRTNGVVDPNDPIIGPQLGDLEPPDSPIGFDDYTGGQAQYEADIITRNNYQVREQIRRANAEDNGRPYKPTPLTPEQLAASQRLQEFQAAGGQVEPPMRMGTPGASAATPPSSTVPQQAAPTSTRPVQPQQQATTVRMQGTPSSTQAAPPVSTVADAPTGSLRDETATLGRIVDTDTGEVLVRKADIPDDLPNLQTAVDEAARIIQEPRAPGRTLARAVVGGGNPQDVALEIGVAAIQRGDIATARAMDEFIGRVEATMRQSLGGDTRFVAVGEETTGGRLGSHVNVPDKQTTPSGVGFPISDAERVLLGKDPYGKRNGLLRLAYEDVMRMLHSETAGNTIGSSYYPGSSLPTRAPDAFRKNADGNFVGEDFRYLSREYVYTPDEARAARIMAVLQDASDAPYIGVSADGTAYVTRIPGGVRARSADKTFMQDDLYRWLREARKQHQEALLKPQTRNHSAQFGGGLAAESKKAADAIREAGNTEAAMRATAAVENARATQLLLDDTVKVADDAGISVEDVVPGININELTYGELWNVRREVNAAARAAAAPTNDPPGNVVARLQWKRNPQGDQPWGTQNAIVQESDGTYSVWYRNENSGEWLPPPARDNVFSDRASVQRFVQEELSRGDSHGPWATLLSDDETFASPRVADWRSTPDAGPASPTNVQYIGGRHPSMDIPEYVRREGVSDATPYEEPGVNAWAEDDLELTIDRLESQLEVDIQNGWRTPDEIAAERKRIDDLIRDSETHPRDRGVSDASFRVLDDVAEAAAPTASATPSGEVRKVRDGKWEAVDGDGNVIGVNPTKRDAQTRLDRWIENHGGTVGFRVDPGAGARNFRRRLDAGRDALQRTADSSAAPNLQNPDLRYANEIGELKNATATYLDQTIAWKPPKGSPPGLEGQEWSVWDAIGYVRMEALVNPKFDEFAELQKIADMAAHFDPKAEPMLSRGLDRLSRTKMVKLYDGAMNALVRQHRRHGPLSIARNFVGDWVGTNWQLAVMAEGDPMWAMRPWNLRHDVQAYVKQGRDPHRWAESMDSPFLSGTGQLFPKKVMPGVSRGETALGGKPIVNEWAEQWFGPWLGKTANVWTTSFGKDWLNQIDLTTRKSLWNAQYEQIARREGMPAFAKKLVEVAGDADTARQWQELIEREAQRKLGDAPYSGAFSPGDIRDALRGVTNRNTELSRAWQSELKLAQDAALKRVEKVLFSYRNTNLDEIARRIFVFHYWQSRAIPLHVRATLRNPILLMSYWRFWNALEQAADDNGLMPDYMRGPFTTMAQFYQSPTGISMHASPMSVLLPTTQFDLMDQNESTGTVFINQMSPMIGGAAAVLGLTDVVPASLTNNDETFIRRMTNYMRGQGWDIPGLSQTWDMSNTTADWNRNALDAVNQWLQDRGIPVGDYQPFNPGASEMDQLRSWVQYEADQQFGPRYGLNGEELWTAEQMAMYEEALVGVQAGVEGNPLSDAAREHLGNEDGLTAAFGMVIPSGVAATSDFRELQKKMAGRWYDQGFTGTPEEQAAASFRGEAKATDPAWYIANQEWHNLGTPDQQQIWDTYFNMINNPEMFRNTYMYVWNEETQSIQTWDSNVLVNADEDTRRYWAQQWLNQIPGGPEAIQSISDQRDAFKTANPGYADYQTYKSGVYQYPGGGAAAYRQDMQANPNFKRAEDEKRAELKRRGYTGAVLEAELDQWAASEEAYHAAIGEQFNIYDQPALPLYDGSKDPYANTGFTNAMATGAPAPAYDNGMRSNERKKGPKVDPPLAVQWQELENRQGWASSVGELMYGDMWNEAEGKWEKWVKPHHREELGLPGGQSDYYITESGAPYPGDSNNSNRYTEWRLYMKRTNPNITEAQLSIDAWTAWELGMFEEYLASQGQGAAQASPPDVWQRYLDDEAA